MFDKVHDHISDLGVNKYSLIIIRTHVYGAKPSTFDYTSSSLSPGLWAEPELINLEGTVGGTIK